MSNHQVQDARPAMPQVAALVGNVNNHAVSVICRVFFLACRVPSNCWLLYIEASPVHFRCSRSHAVPNLPQGYQPGRFCEWLGPFSQRTQQRSLRRASWVLGCVTDHEG
jgi:hypothetical protein